MLSLLDAPWLKKQVETHLFFGFCSQKFPVAILLIVAYISDLLYKIIRIGGIRAWSGYVSDYFHERPVYALFSAGYSISLIFICIFLLKLPKYYQAAIGWWIIKALLVLLCFIMLIVGGLVGFFQGTPDAIYVTLISLLWFPSIEFIKKVQGKQKFITIGRLLLSAPILYLWHKTGT